MMCGSPACFIGGLFLVENAAKHFPGRTGKTVFPRQPDGDFVVFCRGEVRALRNGVFPACPVEELPGRTPGPGMADTGAEKSA